MQVVGGLPSAGGRVEGVVDCAVKKLVGVEEGRLPTEDFTVDPVEDQLTGKYDPREAGVGWE